MTIRTLAYPAALLAALALTFSAQAPTVARATDQPAPPPPSATLEATPGAGAAPTASVTPTPGAPQATPAPQNTGASDTEDAISTAPTGACSDLVTTPAILASDRRPDGTAITYAPSPSGRITPVVFVHGWISWVTHDEERTGYFSHYIDKTADGAAGIVRGDDNRYTSLIGLIQQIPGAAPYLFDYSNVASRWVTDPEIGPRLGRALTCLAQTYGVKPVVIAHSMGGNATREALAQPDGNGGTIADHVGRVITFGTPNTGSDTAALIADGIDTAGKPLILGAPARLIKSALESCGDKMDANNTGCTGVKLLDAFYSEGGRALRTGSPEMKALPQWPKSVPVTALAGDIKVGGITMFGWSSRRAFDLGDMLVSPASATAGATESQTIQCEYGIISTASAGNGIKIIAGLINHSDRPATLASTPCWHEALLRETTLTDHAARVVTDYAAAPISDEPRPASAGAR